MVAPNAQMRILVADNDDGMRQALVEFLQEEGYATLEASRPDEARRLLREGNVDVAVLDVRLLNDN
ncbi:MAG TPA: response regulator, partial [Anaerolineae bacterium]|nr:response regulator [Anaerolineae bacterium]